VCLKLFDFLHVKWKILKITWNEEAEIYKNQIHVYSNEHTKDKVKKGEKQQQHIIIIIIRVTWQSEGFKHITVNHKKVTVTLIYQLSFYTMTHIF
jgi:hypothetical protein